MPEISVNVEDDFIRNRSRYVKWLNATSGDTFAAMALAGHSDKTAHFFGNFDGATVELQGSNDPLVLTDPGNAEWVTLKNAQGLDLSAASNTLEIIIENPIYIRPAITGGTGLTDVSVVLCARIVK